MARTSLSIREVFVRIRRGVRAFYRSAKNQDVKTITRFLGVQTNLCGK